MFDQYLHDAAAILGLWVLMGIGTLAILGVTAWVVVTLLRLQVSQGDDPQDRSPRSPSPFTRHQEADPRDRTAGASHEGAYVRESDHMVHIVGG